MSAKRILPQAHHRPREPENRKTQISPVLCIVAQRAGGCKEEIDAYMAKKVSYQKAITNVTRNLMRRKDIRTQKELAERIGIPYTTFNGYFRNESRWDLSALLKIHASERYTAEEWLSIIIPNAEQMTDAEWVAMRRR